MRPRHASRDLCRAREFEAYVAGAGGRLLHTATLLTAEAPGDNPHARRLLIRALAHTYASWDRLRGDDPYEVTRRYLAIRFAHGVRHRHRGLLRSRPLPQSPLARLSPRERLVLVLRFHEGVAEERTAALLGLPADRVRTICHRATAALLDPPREPAPAVGGAGAAPS
ncbi:MULTISPECIES: sigma factor-like helix-turn-helix DNA-binding protein [Streptomyces]|uniref:sigma factor-like helix-turn-helix DNA-binding protein n=1 Tax=Streptomyces TaxID=1883 RepID=UPI000D674DD8|nr:sigma factor-like helix-turn-helix DNA-binding protein [Streptomyces sp. NWU49]PWJ03177.1 RNA polymerase subunit sigma-70 [Streptomyces sp. NWU49]